MICDMDFLAAGCGADRKRVRLRSEDARPLVGLAAAAEEEQRKTALGACHDVTVTPLTGCSPKKITWRDDGPYGTLV